MPNNEKDAAEHAVARKTANTKGRFDVRGLPRRSCAAECQFAIFSSLPFPFQHAGHHVRRAHGARCAKTSATFSFAGSTAQWWYVKSDGQRWCSRPLPGGSAPAKKKRKNKKKKKTGAVPTVKPVDVYKQNVADEDSYSSSDEDSYTEGEDEGTSGYKKGEFGSMRSVECFPHASLLQEATIP